MLISIPIPFEVLETWFNENPRYAAIFETEDFKGELHSAYEYLKEKAGKKVVMENEQEFSELVKRYIMAEFAKAVIPAQISGKTNADIEESTIFNHNWMSKEIIKARESVGHSIQVKLWEENRKEMIPRKPTHRSDEEGWWND